MISAAIEKVLTNKIGCKVVGALQDTGLRSSANQFFIYETDKGVFFVKVKEDDSLEPLAAEAKGLEAIVETETINAPAPYFYGFLENQCFLILEYIELHSHTPASQELLGRQLAKMHLKKGPESFGFMIDGTIGANEQVNSWSDNWVDFFVNNRLLFQLDLAEANYGDSELLQKGEGLIDKIDNYFKGMTITPSLLHGDLWIGNSGADSEGNPFIYDPACYYGHHEADLSIAAMFGGFGQSFFDAYHEIIPRAGGFEERQQIYQLYHYLNHYNIFGNAYRPACVTLLEKYS